MNNQNESACEIMPSANRHARPNQSDFSPTTLRLDRPAGLALRKSSASPPDARHPTVHLPIMKKILLSVLLAIGFAATSAIASDTAPTSIVHVVTVSWKADAKPEQIQAALDGVQALPAAYKGITHVWTKTLKAQGDRSHIIVMEFADADAFKAYTGSDAQKEWYKLYLPIRERSTTFDATN